MGVDVQTYYVKTTTNVVTEMARYDNAIVTRGPFVRLGIINPITNEQMAINKCVELGMNTDIQLVYEWRLTSKHVTVARWQSFGVAVNMVKNQ